jgi:hypothetical protein
MARFEAGLFWKRTSPLLALSVAKKVSGGSPGVLNENRNHANQA